MARTGSDAMGAGPYSGWQAAHPQVRLVPAAEAGAGAELLVNATAGLASVDALRGAGVGDRPGLAVMDVANALEFDGGAPRLAVTGADSLGERIQRAFPDARVVKTLHTMNCEVMARPDRVPGEHVVFVAGDDAAAKRTVSGLLVDMGWKPAAVVDLGGIATARSTEMVMPLWLTLAGVLGTADFNFAIARA
jgi:predicted dinucleotide-binding enzyme